ncbi:MAG: universal stress protein [Cytophagales bacterium]
MKLLVPTNFTQIAQMALDSAITLTHQMLKTEIILVHFEIHEQNSVIQITEDVVVQNDLEETFKKCKLNLQAIQKQFPTQKINMVYIAYEKEAFLYEQIDKIEADLIVMGTQSVERYENEKLVGNNTKRFIKNLKTPILCLKNNLSTDDIEKIVFASSLKGKHIDEINKLTPLFEGLKCTVEILHICTPDKFLTTDKAEKLFEHHKPQIKYKNLEFKMVNDIGTAEGLVNYCNQNQIKLFVLPIHSKKYLDRLINGSLSEMVLDDINTPTISIASN